jgi:hypothetical protein
VELYKIRLLGLPEEKEKGALGEYPPAPRGLSDALAARRYACVRLDHRPEYRPLRDLCEPEAEVCRAIADLLMEVSGREVLADEEIETFYPG